MTPTNSKRFEIEEAIELLVEAYRDGNDDESSVEAYRDHLEMDSDAVASEWRRMFDEIATFGIEENGANVIAIE
jgi:hypothetical protein